MGCGPSSDNKSVSSHSTDSRTIKRSNSDIHDRNSVDNRPSRQSSFSLSKTSSFAQPVVTPNTIKGLVGLKNLGNTCYMNCSLQCLSHTIQLADYFMLSSNWKSQINRSNPIGHNGDVAEAFGELLSEIYGNVLECDDFNIDIDITGDKGDSQNDNSKVVTPSKIKNTLAKYQSLFRGNSQQDAQELLAFLLDGLHEDLNQVKTKPWVEDITSDGNADDREVAREAWDRYLQRNKSIIVELLQGQLKSTLRCSTCGTQSIKFETFMFLTLPIPESKQTVTLNDCLEEFCRIEKLTGEHKWRCPHCKEFREAEKRIELWSTPPVLIVHLKRFHHEANGRKFKLNTMVKFPTKSLDLSSMVLNKNPDPMYDLHGVSNHHGSLQGGHYTATIRNRFDDQWYVCNDSINQEIDEMNVCTADAYVLYFHRRENTGRKFSESEEPAKTWPVVKPGDLPVCPPSEPTCAPPVKAPVPSQSPAIPPAKPTQQQHAPTKPVQPQAAPSKPVQPPAALSKAPAPTHPTKASTQEVSKKGAQSMVSQPMVSLPEPPSTSPRVFEQVSRLNSRSNSISGASLSDKGGKKKVRIVLNIDVPPILDDYGHLNPSPTKTDSESSSVQNSEDPSPSDEMLKNRRPSMSADKLGSQIPNNVKRPNKPIQNSEAAIYTSMRL